jgi:hypothetical protein
MRGSRELATLHALGGALLRFEPRCRHGLREIHPIDTF